MASSLHAIRIAADRNELALMHLAQAICNISAQAKKNGHTKLLKSELREIKDSLKKIDLSQIDKDRFKEIESSFESF